MLRRQRCPRIPKHVLVDVIDGDERDVEMAAVAQRPQKDLTVCGNAQDCDGGVTREPRVGEPSQPQRVDAQRLVDEILDDVAVANENLKNVFRSLRR